jgi:DNA modification methylase
MRSRAFCKTCQKYVIDDELIKCRLSGHDMKAHPRDYDLWLSDEKLKDSQSIREKIIQKYGRVPESFDLTKPRNRVLDEWIGDLASGTYAVMGWSTRSGALALAPVNQLKNDILMYSEKGDIVCNLMMERCPHLLIANYYGRNAIGGDICKKFYLHDVEKIKQKIMSSEKLFPDKNKVIKHTDNMFLGLLQGCKMELHLGDSTDVSSWLPDESVDFCITSPPYFHCASYGDEPEQIGTGSVTYEEFLSKLKEIFREFFRVLKRGRFFSVQVNDFRQDKKFYFYHCDVIRILNEIGFVNHDIRVYQVGTLSSIFASEMERDKRSAKTHEYLIVVRKPEDMSLINFEKKEKQKKVVEEKKQEKEETEESVYEEPKDIRYVDKTKLSEQGTMDSLNYYTTKK